MSIIWVVCEGQSENRFVKEVLCPYVLEKTAYSIELKPITLTTSKNKKAGKVYKGGLVRYEKAINDIRESLAYGGVVTTMFDFYAIPVDFPGYDVAMKAGSSLDRVTRLEESMIEDVIKRLGVREDCFIPYIQLHEFEALFYCELNALKDFYPDKSEDIDKLIKEVSGFEPEEIDQGSETAPSKRLLKHLNYRKGEMVVFPLQKIGIDRMREKCPHFNEWVERLIGKAYV